MSEKRKFLIWFAHEHSEFKLAEFEAVASLEKISFHFLSDNPRNPFILIESTESEVRKIATRCVMVKYVIEVWSVADNYIDFNCRLRNCEYRKLHRFCSKDKSYKINVETFGKKVPFNEQIQKIEKLELLEFQGSFDLRNPENVFYLIEFYGLDANNVPDKPFSIFFGRWISSGQRNLIHELNLKNRKFISNTSMDPLLSLLMANIAKVKPQDFVIDPFVGSGSILVAAAKFGAFVVGTDIDYMLMYGRSKPTRSGALIRESDETIYSNLKQYNLQSQYIDILVADSSLPNFRKSFKFDAIITDPPYGIREASSKIGSEKKYKIPAELCEGHVPAKIRYTFSDIVADLLNFAAIHLKIGGRLVFWIPFPKGTVNQIDFKEPSHPCLILISKCQQILSKNSSRVLICMEKVKEEFLHKCYIASDGDKCVENIGPVSVVRRHFTVLQYGIRSENVICQLLSIKRN